MTIATVAQMVRLAAEAELRTATELCLPPTHGGIGQSEDLPVGVRRS